MPERPQEKSESEVENDAKRDTWEKDQKHRGYYYDDAHGYEVFHPENEESEDEPEIISTNEPC